ncbi:hypothetical protein GDO86_003633 [Hymenochirus boettgeri]|uniref:LIM zinc-binding domain-containing protein n=1 Tax=Hymenochirus boettgeri TaxID=247094 RepID=A0A8T2KAG0_9PIPI|nr:hypothetical protein GDO86_003633 [Hymenochirus boettgeri]
MFIHPRNQNHYCIPCYETKLAPRCTHCKKSLTKGGVTYRDEPWHKECFVCTGCKTQLAGSSLLPRMRSHSASSVLATCMPKNALVALSLSQVLAELSMCPSKTDIGITPVSTALVALLLCGEGLYPRQRGHPLSCM